MDSQLSFPSCFQLLLLLLSQLNLADLFGSEIWLPCWKLFGPPGRSNGSRKWRANWARCRGSKRPRPQELQESFLQPRIKEVLVRPILNVKAEAPRLVLANKRFWKTPGPRKKIQQPWSWPQSLFNAPKLLGKLNLVAFELQNFPNYVYYLFFSFLRAPTAESFSSATAGRNSAIRTFRSLLRSTSGPRTEYRSSPNGALRWGRRARHR